MNPFQIICCFKNISTYDAVDVTSTVEYYRSEGDNFYPINRLDTVRYSDEELIFPILNYKASLTPVFNLLGVSEVRQNDHILIRVKFSNKRKEKQPDFVAIFKMDCNPYTKLKEADSEVFKMLLEISNKIWSNQTVNKQ